MRLLLKLGAHISFVGFLASVAIFASLNLQAYTDGLVSTTSTATSNFSKQTLSVYADNLGSIASTVNAQEKEDQKTVLAANTPQASVIDAGAPLSLPTPVVVPRPAVQQEAVVTTPYSLNDEAAAQLSSLGYSLTDLRTQGVTVIGHSGAVPRRCATGTSGGLYAQGMALRASARYTPCPDGGSPLYDAYRPAGYTCVVVYNSQSSKSLAVLAHEVGHCLHFTYGQYQQFDTDYRSIRGISAATLDRNKTNEIIADDFMICRHGLDTDFGASSYYSRFGVSRPTTQQCTNINALITTHLIR